MNRSGLNTDELKNAITIIKENADYIEIAGFCTHLAGAESVSNHVRIQSQLKKYRKMLANLEANDIDMMIFASVTPDAKLPNSACILQTKLGITNK